MLVLYECIDNKNYSVRVPQLAYLLADFYRSLIPFTWVNKKSTESKDVQVFILESIFMTRSHVVVIRLLSPHRRGSISCLDSFSKNCCLSMLPLID
jgi:hypothetical protein